MPSMSLSLSACPPAGPATKPSGQGKVIADSCLTGDVEDGSEFPQALLELTAQWSPEVLAVLQQMLAGGMELPQAAQWLQARQVSDGLPGNTAAVPGQIGALAADIVAGVIEHATDSEASAGKALDAVLGDMARRLPALDVTGGGAAQPMRGMPEVATTARPAGFSDLLTSNLLSMGVPQRVASPGWDRAVGDRVVWMLQGEQQVAKLTLSPPNLGPLEIRVTLNNDQASVAFIAQHAAVRDALEQAIPRLREMLEQQSLQLVSVDVGQHDPGSRGTSDGGGAGNGTGTINGVGSMDEKGGEIGSAIQVDTRQLTGLVDLFV